MSSPWFRAVWIGWLASGLILGVALWAAGPAAAEAARSTGAVRLSAEPDPSDTTRVRVRLLESIGPESVRVTPVGGTVHLRREQNGSPLLRIEAGDTVTLGVRGDELAVRLSTRGLYTPDLLLDPDPGVSWKLAWTDGSRDRARTYEGPLFVQPDPKKAGRIQLVNASPLESYVASVVAAEYGFDDLEGAKAMAVVARTYALKAADKFDGRYDHVDHTASQVYRGTSAITGVARRAARETRGEVVTYNDTLIEAVYFSSSGGHTADNEDVWDADESLPYLRGKRDPYDGNSPHHRWTTRIDRRPLLRALEERLGGSVRGFVIGERSEGRRVKNVDILRPGGSREPMQANAFRLLVNRAVPGAEMKSTWFDARREGDEYVLDGRGFGHGVGLSQWGAHEMSQRGKSYRDILSFYYDDIRVQRLDGVKVAPTLPPVAKEEADAPERGGGRIGW
jgi:stage II sporulation protein D